MATSIDSARPVAVQSGDGNVHQFPGDAEARRFEAAALEAGGETLRLVPAMPPTARPLYELEAHLSALVDSEELVTPEQEQEYALELHATLVATVAKRDRVGQFRGWLQSQIAFAHAEKMRLETREHFFQHALDTLDSYLTRVIDMLGLDSKGKRKKLEGSVCTLGLHGCDRSVEVTDEEAVPTRYKRVVLVLPYDTWETIKDSLDLDLRDQVVGEAKVREVEISRTAVKADLKADVSVPGAKLAGGTYVEVK